MARIWLTFSAIGAVFCFLVVRLFYWQVIRSPELRLEAASQYYFTFTLPAQRGAILASDFKPLVLNQSAYLAYAQPKDIRDIACFSTQVSSILGLDRKNLEIALSEPGKMWVPVAHKVEASRVSELRALALNGLGFEREPKRMYPESSMAAHLVGFVGSDEQGKDRGYFGLEGYYNRELSGKDGYLQLEKDVRGSPILVGETHRTESYDGRSIVL